jgi:hypothetical protein
VIGGDPTGLVFLLPLDHADLQTAACALSKPLVVSRKAVVAVLRGLNQGILLPELVQCWASFVRRGYIAGSTDGPLRPLDIEYEDAWEEAIAATVSRLDEIGDILDGDVQRDEVLDLLQLLADH